MAVTPRAAVATGDGQVKLIPYKGGEYTIPSIFAIDDKGNELIGHEAKRQWQLNPRNTVYAAKRLVGRSYSSDVVGLMKQTVAYEMKQGERYDEKRVKEAHRDHALFIAFAPADNPRLAMALLVENGGHGGSTAAPIAREVFDYFLLGKKPDRKQKLGDDLEEND